MEKSNVKARPDTMDKLVAQNLRRRRLMMGISYSDLASSLGISIQQIQKYEKGINRISSSRLYAIAQSLSTPISLFFQKDNQEVEVLATHSSSFDPVIAPADHEILAIIRAFNHMTNPTLRKKLIELIEYLVRTDSSD